MIVYAVWGYDTNGNGQPDVLEDLYELAYDLNGGSGGPVPNPEQGLLEQTGYTLNPAVPTHLPVGGIAVVFIGWTEVKDTKIYDMTDIAPVTITKVDIAGDTKVFAVWGYDENKNGQPDVLETKYKLTYDVNGGIPGTGPVPNPATVVEMTGYTLSTTAPSHDPTSGVAVLFIGWTEIPDQTIYAKGDIAPTTMKTVDIVGDTEVYAVWGYDENDNGIPDVLENEPKPPGSGSGSGNATIVEPPGNSSPSVPDPNPDPNPGPEVPPKPPVNVSPSHILVLLFLMAVGAFLFIWKRRNEEEEEHYLKN